MTDRLVSGNVEWVAEIEPGSDLCRIRGTSSERDRPIDLTLTPGETASLLAFLELFTTDRGDVFDHVDLRERG